jgi:hypothetical protein
MMLMGKKQIRRTENAIRAAHEELLAADIQAAKLDNGQGCANPFQKRLARKMRREAKRRMSKAERRQGRMLCDSDQEESST